MNPFVNPDHRDVSLPKGRQDLIDLLNAVPGGSEGARVLSYPLPASVPDILTLLTDVLRAACGATEHAGLYYQFH